MNEERKEGKVQIGIKCLQLHFRVMYYPLNNFAQNSLLSLIFVKKIDTYWTFFMALFWLKKHAVEADCLPLGEYMK